MRPHFEIGGFKPSTKICLVRASACSYHLPPFASLSDADNILLIWHEFCCHEKMGQRIYFSALVAAE